MSMIGPQPSDVAPHWKRGEIVEVVIFDSLLYRPGGMVPIWMDKIVTKFTAQARRYAPVRSGELRALIGGNVRKVGPKQMEGTIYSRANHTMFVIDGTHGNQVVWHRTGSFGLRIAPTRSRYLRLRPGPAYPFFSIRTDVSGQLGNNFLIKAWAATARNHRAIRGKGLPTVG